MHGYTIEVTPLSGARLNSESMPLWDNGDMSSARNSLLLPRIMAVTIAVLVVALAVFTWVTPPHAVVLQNILHHLNFLPFMLAGMLFGWRGALKTLLLALVLQTPSIHRHWRSAPLDAQDQIVELSVFAAAGVIAGILADRERLQRKRVEATKLELEGVYTELRQNIQQMKKTERLTAAGQLAASLAHEIRNPLASISGAAGILARGQAPADNREECLNILMRESQRLNKLLTNFLDFARPRLPRFQWTEPVSVINAVAVLAQHAAISHDVELRQQMPARLREVEVDAEQIKQVLLNLIINGVQATEGGGTVLIRSYVTLDKWCVEVCDEGQGVPLEDLDRIFDPFFTTKENGTGLGLAVVANIVAQHGGSLNCNRNSERPGMTFRMELPFERPQPMPLKRPQREVATP
jgi:two-component system sensor histidine kinase HydH